MNGKKKAFIIILFILLTAGFLFVCFQLFRVRSIIVEGSAPADNVKSVCGIEEGKSIFLVDTQAAFDAIEEQTWLKAVEVVRVYPDKIKITADQRQIAAYVQQGDVLLAIDKECVVLMAEASEPIDMPIINGLPMDVFEVGKTIGCSDKFILDIAEKLLDELEGRELKVERIDVSFAANIVLVTESEMRIELGDDMQLDAKLRLAQATIKELTSRGDTSGTLDVSAVTSAYYREK